MHSRCAQWFWNTFHSERRMLIHVDNNSYNKIEGARKKAMGVVKGVSDFILILFEEVHFIELKTDKGIQKDEQIEFMDKVMRRGHNYHIVRSEQEFKDLIYSLLK